MGAPLDHVDLLAPVSHPGRLQRASEGLGAAPAHDADEHAPLERAGRQHERKQRCATPSHTLRPLFKEACLALSSSSLEPSQHPPNPRRRAKLRKARRPPAAARWARRLGPVCATEVCGSEDKACTPRCTEWHSLDWFARRHINLPGTRRFRLVPKKGQDLEGPPGSHSYCIVLLANISGQPLNGTSNDIGIEIYRIDPPLRCCMQ